MIYIDNTKRIFIFIYIIMNMDANDKSVLLESIKAWLQVDNELRELQKASKERREMKKQLTHNLVNVMRENEIDCFDVKDGQLMYKRSVTRGPVNKKLLLTTLSTYLKNDKQAEDLCSFILDSREEKVRETITRKIDKN
jgi:hypothetical protein